MFRFRWFPVQLLDAIEFLHLPHSTPPPCLYLSEINIPQNPSFSAQALHFSRKKRSCGPFLWLGLSLAAGLLPALMGFQSRVCSSAQAEQLHAALSSGPSRVRPHHTTGQHTAESLWDRPTRGPLARDPGRAVCCRGGGWAARRPVFFRLGRSSRDGWSVFHRRLAERVRRKSSVGPEGDRRPRKMRRQTSAATSKKDRKLFETLQLLWNVTPAPHLTWIQRAAAQERHLIFFNFNLHEARNKQKSHSRESYGIKICHRRYSFCIVSKII